MTDKQNPVQISRTSYQGVQYTHQGWFVSDNHSYLLMNDELDERDSNINTTTHIFDVRDLDAPVRFSTYVGPTTAIDHNLYTNNGLVYQSNYRSGLRILSTDNADTGSLEERALRYYPVFGQPPILRSLEQLCFLCQWQYCGQRYRYRLIYSATR